MKMNGGRSDASTSTDDVKSRPLYLFYFTHPFGVLSPEAPTLAAAPPHLTRAFLNMQPVAPSLWGADAAPAAAEPAARPSYELGKATVHRTPLSLVSVARMGTGRDSISSSLFSSDVWFNSSSSCRSNEYPRRFIPFNRILPPLRLPSPKDSSNISSSDDFWPRKCLNPEKFSLPPIEMPSVKVEIVRSKNCTVSSEEMSSAESTAPRPPRAPRRGVRKPRRPEPRRLLAALLRRALAVWCGSVVGGMGCLERVPAVQSCCTLPLRLGAAVCALVGLVWAALYVWLWSAGGARWLRGMAGGSALTAALRPAHGALGTLLAALHALLLLGAARASDALCDVYAWGMLACGAAALLAAALLAGAAALDGRLLFAAAALLAVLLGVLGSFYFVVVVINYRMTMP